MTGLVGSSLTTQERPSSIILHVLQLYGVKTNEIETREPIPLEIKIGRFIYF